jgi:hypothetical protein
MERTTLHETPILSRRSRVGHRALPELALFGAVVPGGGWHRQGLGPWRWSFAARLRQIGFVCTRGPSRTLPAGHGTELALFDAPDKSLVQPNRPPISARKRGSGPNSATFVVGVLFGAIHAGRGPQSCLCAPISGHQGPNWVCLTRFTLPRGRPTYPSPPKFGFVSHNCPRRLSSPRRRPPAVAGNWLCLYKQSRRWPGIGFVSHSYSPRRQGGHGEESRDCLCDLCASVVKLGTCKGECSFDSTDETLRICTDAFMLFDFVGCI